MKITLWNMKRVKNCGLWNKVNKVLLEKNLNNEIGLLQCI